MESDELRIGHGRAGRGGEAARRPLRHGPHHAGRVRDARDGRLRGDDPGRPAAAVPRPRRSRTRASSGRAGCTRSDDDAAADVRAQSTRTRAPAPMPYAPSMPVPSLAPVEDGGRGAADRAAVRRRPVLHRPDRARCWLSSSSRPDTGVGMIWPIIDGIVLLNNGGSDARAARAPRAPQRGLRASDAPKAALGSVATKATLGRFGSGLLALGERVGLVLHGASAGRVVAAPESTACAARMPLTPRRR